jgi:predicted nucleotidyltransferase
MRELQPQLHDRYGVSGLWVFGSFVRGEQKGSSDLDVLVEFDRPGMTLLKFVDLEMRLGLKVDLVQRRVLRPRIRSNVLAEAVAV